MQPPNPQGPDMDKVKYLEVQIENVSLFNYNFIVLLKHEGEHNVLPICIGAAEAHSIAAAFNHQNFPRPLTHDLVKNILSEAGCQVIRIHVTDLKDSTFYASIFLRRPDGEVVEIDSRPSDAIALALRYRAPIFVREDVFRDNAVNYSSREDEEGEVQDKDAAKGEVPPVPPARSRDPLTIVKEQLESAIRDERYEEAARLRDEILRLEKQHN